MAGCAAPWSREQFQAVVAQAGAHAERGARLVGLLDEAHAAYAECSSAEVARRRGWILVELGHAPLEPCAWPVVLDALQTAHEPYLLAAAARALRQAAQPEASLGPSLLRATDALSRRNDFVDLACWGGATDDDSGATALTEAIRTLQWMGPHLGGQRAALAEIVRAPGLAIEHANAIGQILRDPACTVTDGTETCCSWRAPAQIPTAVASAHAVARIRLQDDTGAERDWHSQLDGQPTLLAFFYTRCDNPLKCSLTISQLARVQGLLATAGLAASVRIAAITYDSDFDSPARMASYAQARGLRLDAQCRMLRVVEGADVVRSHLGSGVNFVGTLVNWHRIELFVLDSSGRPAVVHQRLSWNPEEVVADLRQVLAARPHGRAPGLHPERSRALVGTAPVLWATCLALLPKCPICGATYLSLTGVAALPLMDGWSIAWPLALVLLVANVGLLGWMARKGGRSAPVVVTAAGALMIAGPGLALGMDLAMSGGLALTTLGSLAAVLRFPARSKGGSTGQSRWHAMRNGVRGLWRRAAS